jgi:hypothetical protein
MLGDGGGQLDLNGLAAESPIALSQSQRQNRQHKEHRVSLADFTKQRQQMQELERQYSDMPSSYNDEPMQSGYDGKGWDEDAMRERGYDDEPDDYNADPVSSAEAENAIDQELSELQADREKEFLSLFCERLSGYPEEVAVSIIDELADRLREKVISSYRLNGWYQNQSVLCAMCYVYS